jgi:hypothetical protein
MKRGDTMARSTERTVLQIECSGSECELLTHAKREQHETPEAVFPDVKSQTSQRGRDMMTEASL